jgi:hypothetical protein
VVAPPHPLVFLFFGGAEHDMNLLVSHVRAAEKTKK